MARTTKHATDRQLRLTLEDVENRMLEARGKLALLEAFAHGQSLPDTDQVDPEAWWGLQLILGEVKESLDVEIRDETSTAGRAAPKTAEVLQ